MMRRLQLQGKELCIKGSELSLLLSRYIRPFPSNAKVWGSSVIQLNPILDRNIVSRNRLLFRRRFRRCRITHNGQKMCPNGIQLATLRPQLGGSDLFIAAPSNSGKTLSYLLPEVFKYRYGKLDCIEKPEKILVLVPTLDLILQGSRMASGSLKEVANVQPLYYKRLANGEDLSDISNANVVYSTPASAYRLILKQPNVFNNVRTLIIDEANRILNGQSAVFAVKIKSMLPENLQTIVLAPRNEDKLRQFTSRLLRVNFRVISFCPEYKNVPITQHIPGPQRSGVSIPEDKVHSVVPTEKTELELQVERNRLKVLDHCKIRQVYVDKDVKCEYILYKPIEFTNALLSAIVEHDKVIVIFPTVKMVQFCYIYFKHVMKIHSGTDKQFYALHGHLSPEKRRFVVDIFSSCKRGILFATDVVSVGLSFPHVEAVIQVGAAGSVDVFADRVGCSLFHESDEKGCYNLLLLHDLDAHILYEASLYNCDIKRRSETLGDTGHKIDTKWVNSPSYLASCELMYRSLLGYYCNNAQRLKFQRWQIPSLVNEIIRSFGHSSVFTVSKQFVARMKLLDAPGLSVKYDSVEKTQLQAAVLAYSGFRSRVLQGGVSAKGFSKVAEMQIRPVPLKCSQEC